MTVIAWDGKTLAADKRASNSGLARTTTKIFQVGPALVGFCGDADASAEMLAWVCGGCVPGSFPEGNRDKDGWAQCVFIDASGLRIYERTPYAIQIEDAFWAGGSGRDFAIAAMHLGKSARDAVEIACLYETGCGNGIDTLELP